MVEQLSTLLVRSGAEWVLYTLLAMSVFALSIAAERWLALRRATGDLAARAAELRTRLRRDPLLKVRSWLDAEGGVDAIVVAAGVDAAANGPAAAEAAMAAQVGIARRSLSRGLVWIGSVGSNAPFVGLLGTVIGVVGAFDALGSSDGITGAGGLAPERVMSTIGEALVATAVGLFVAIPAIMIFNHFQTRIANLLSDAEALGQVLLSWLHGQSAARRSELRDELSALAAEE